MFGLGAKSVEPLLGEIIVFNYVFMYLIIALKSKHPSLSLSIEFIHCKLVNPLNYLVNYET
jgi:hypothetical protein